MQYYTTYLKVQHVKRQRLISELDKCGIYFGF